MKEKKTIIFIFNDGFRKEMEVEVPVRDQYIVKHPNKNTQFTDLSLFVKMKPFRQAGPNTYIYKEEGNIGT